MSVLAFSRELERSLQVRFQAKSERCLFHEGSNSVLLRTYCAHTPYVQGEDTLWSPEKFRDGALAWKKASRRRRRK